MATVNTITKKSLEDKGYVWDEKQQCYIHPRQLTIGEVVKDPTPIIISHTVSKSILGRPKLNTPHIGDEMFSHETGCRITLAGLTPGLNSSNGLMRSHWTKKKKLQEEYVNRIKALNPPMTYMKPVSIVYVRHCSKFMDWDNCGASFKLIGDALVATKILIDDDPKHIVQFIPKQTRVKRKEQHLEIIITVI